MTPRAHDHARRRDNPSIRPSDAATGSTRIRKRYLVSVLAGVAALGGMAASSITDVATPAWSVSAAGTDLVPVRAPLGGPSEGATDLPIVVSVADRFDVERQIRAAADARRAREAHARAEEEARQQAATRAEVWDRLADCESGDWDRNGVPIPGSARWDYGISYSHGDIYEGGLNFHPGTWDAYRDAGMPSHAGHATREQQIAVGERVLAAQGWRAWPVCSRKIGAR